VRQYSWAVDLAEIAVEKWVRRRVGEIWTRQGGQRVIKLPNGHIVPYRGPKKDTASKKGGEEESPRGDHVKAAAKRRLAVMQRRLQKLTELSRGGAGGFKSAHFAKERDVLIAEVKALLDRIERDPNCKRFKPSVWREMRAETKNLNKRVCKAEKFAVKYGRRGLRASPSVTITDAEKTFWLGVSLIFGDISVSLAKRRDLMLKAKA